MKHFDFARLIPGTAAPELALDTTSGPWTLAESAPDNFTMLVFYRGLHCPVCKGFLSELNRLIPDFANVGTKVLGISMDDAERANKSVTDWELDQLNLGYGLTEDQARTWGLYLSGAIKETETAVFCEPGLFLVDKAGHLYLINISSMPFARPDIAGLPAKIAFATANSYPARGGRV